MEVSKFIRTHEVGVLKSELVKHSSFEWGMENNGSRGLSGDEVRGRSREGSI